MKKLILIFIPILMSTAQPATGKIEGTVTNALTKLPIPNVQISFNNVNAAQQGNPAGNFVVIDPNDSNVLTLVDQLNFVLAGTSQQPTVFTDQSGQFIIAGLSPGTYTVTAQLDGYFGPDAIGTTYPRASTNINVTATQASDVTIPMIPGGTISGQIRTDRGLPAVDTTVQALKVAYNNVAMTVQVGGTRTTDDRGIFRLYGLMPGEYVVAVIPPPPLGARGGRGAADPVIASPAAQSAPGRTYFPNVSELSQASRIQLHPGEEVSGINIDFQSAKSGKISGQVLSSIPAAEMVSRPQAGRGNASSVPNATLTLYPHDKNVPQDPTNTSSVSVPLGGTANGHFQFPNVSPGVYDLYASVPDIKGYGPAQPPGRASSPVAYGRTTVDVRGGEQDGVSVTVHHGVDIKGIVTIDGAPSLSINNVRFSLQADDSASKVAVYQQVGRYQLTIEPDGSFTIPAVPEAQYRFQITFGPPPPLDEPATPGPPLGPNTYVADILRSGMTVFDNGISVGADAVEPLDVRVKTDGGRIEGVVLDAKRTPYAGATVILVPSDQHRLNPALHKMAISDETGHFSMSGIRPDEYKLLAWESTPPGAYVNADILDSYREMGVSVNVAANGRLDTQVGLIPLHH